ncbi:hypothetical protein GRX03_01825 [Halovenus sp. WSH3]|uniref:Uncharacterized protein n=1 Tax=Halovenus carboxidivorans TaxID=2692199 RepID=A0A6B0TAZ4_9EURY|nr:hypothetical protein [Halovenus carboxidivorans]MXR50349.1 hypothetical protein [Halovenus carboxidivorans]
MVRRYLAAVDRRYLVAGVVGAVGVAITAALVALKLGLLRRLPLIGPDPDHLIELRNERDQPQNVAVEYEVDGDGMEHGPWRIKPGEIWGVSRVTTPGTMSLTVTVDGETELDEETEIPIPDEGSSATVVTLHEAGFATSSLRFED